MSNKTCGACKNWGWYIKGSVPWCGLHQRYVDRNDKACKTGYLPLDSIKSKRKTKNESR